MCCLCERACQSILQAYRSNCAGRRADDVRPRPATSDWNSDGRKSLQVSLDGYGFHLAALFGNCRDCDRFQSVLLVDTKHESDGHHADRAGNAGSSGDPGNDRAQRNIGVAHARGRFDDCLRNRSDCDAEDEEGNELSFG